MSASELALRVDLYIHDERASVPTLTPQLEAIMSALDVLRAEVADNRGVINSAITLLNGLKAQLDEAIATGDPGSLIELAAELESQTNRLAEAVALNTDPAPAEPEPPQPTEDATPEEPEPLDPLAAAAAPRRRPR